MMLFADRCYTLFTRLLLSRYFVPGCLGMALLLRLAWVLTVHPDPTSDFRWYYLHAQGLAAGKGYADFGISTAYFPPGYPGFLALLFVLAGPALWVAKAASLLLQLGTLLLAYLAARRLGFTEVTARLTLLLLALHPNNIGYSSLLASEHLFLFLMLLGAVLLLTAVDLRRPRYGMLALAGVVWGLAVLTRPQAVLVPAIILLLAALRARAWRPVVLPFLIVHLLLAAILLPWLARNARVFGRPLVTTTTGINLFMGNNPDARGTYVFTERMRAMLPVRDWTTVANPGSRPEYQFDADCRAAAMAYIKTHPLQTLALLPLKLAWLYQSEIDAIDWNKAGVKAHNPRLAARLDYLVIPFQGYYTFVVVLFLAVLLSAKNRELIRRRAGAFPCLGLWIVAYFTAVYLVYYGMPRYHIPMFPWMAMYAAALLEIVITQSRRVAGVTPVLDEPAPETVTVGS